MARGVGGLPGPEPSADQMVSWALIPRGFTLLPWEGRHSPLKEAGQEGKPREHLPGGKVMGGAWTEGPLTEENIDLPGARR